MANSIIGLGLPKRDRSGCLLAFAFRKPPVRFRPKRCLSATRLISVIKREFAPARRQTSRKGDWKRAATYGPCWVAKAITNVTQKLRPERRMAYARSG